MHIHIFPKEILVKETVRALDTIFALQKDTPFLFLCSGGSSLALLEYMDARNFGSRSTICVLDERYSEDPEINNFAQLTKTDFYKKARNAQAHFIDTRPRENESKDLLAERFENELRDWINNNPIGKIIATIGIGPDAHIAGIMPYPEDATSFEKTFNNENRWVTAYDAGTKNQYPLRITVTLPFLRKINAAIAFVQGDNKTIALKKLSAKNGSLNEAPCRILHELSDIEIFTDQKIQDQ